MADTLATGTLTLEQLEAWLAQGLIEAQMEGEWWRVKRNGATQTWIDRPGEYLIPIKAGLRFYENITPANLGNFRLKG